MLLSLSIAFIRKRGISSIGIEALSPAGRPLTWFKYRNYNFCFKKDCEDLGTKTMAFFSNHLFWLPCQYTENGMYYSGDTFGSEPMITIFWWSQLIKHGSLLLGMRIRCIKLWFLVGDCVENITTKSVVHSCTRVDIVMDTRPYCLIA
mgnify:CR=1 FL=1